MKLPQTGGCQCGKLRYEITEMPRLTYACHCRDCQRMTGSAFSMAVVVSDAAFRLSGAEPRPIERIADSGRTAIRWVCPECGSWICSGPKPGTAPPDTLRRVRAGTLDDTSWPHPTLHYFARSKQAWIVLPEGGHSFETQPEDLTPFLAPAR
ncbi:MAG TPA: GFA family protein [Stellaceae bacterium]|nr:GFA family protein [Stellaceae bacterium]